MSAMITFCLTGGGHDIGEGGSIQWAQEKQTNFNSANYKAPPEEWVPAEGGDSTYYYALGNYVIDEKQMPFDEVTWGNTPDGTSLLGYTQHFRVLLPYTDGTNQWFEFGGSWQFSYVKVSNNTWKVKL